MHRLIYGILALTFTLVALPAHAAKAVEKDFSQLEIAKVEKNLSGLSIDTSIGAKQLASIFISKAPRGK